MDLAKRDTPLKSQPQTTFRRETTMPRQATDLPGLEVNAAIHRPDTSGAEALSQLLGLANNVGQKVLGDVQDKKNTEDEAAALLDYGTGQQNKEKYAKSIAYRDAWQLQGAKQTAIAVSTDVTDRINTRLNDENDPPTVEDLDGIFEQTLHDHLMGPDGKPLDFITPQAKLTLGTALSKLKAELMPKAAQAIAQRQNQRLYNTTFNNMVFERDAGAEIGAPPAAPGTVASPTADGIDTSKPYYVPPIPKGWKGNQEDAIRELGMTADEAAKFLKTGKDPRTAASAAPSPAFKSVKALIASAESGGSGGDGARNTQSTASGRYQFTDGTFKALGGNMAKKNNPAEQERVMDKLLTQNTAALRDAGISVTPGNLYLAHFLGAPGAIHAMSNPGDPVSAKVQKANPFTKGWTNLDVVHWAQRKMGQAAANGVVIEDGSEPQLTTAPAQHEVLKPGFDVERFMASLPPSVNKGEAKAWLLPSLIAHASSTGDTSILNGLEDSVRKDGTPSFSPEERIKIVETRDTLREKNRVEADRAEKKMQEDNAGLVLQAFAEDNPPSTSWMNEQSRKGLLDQRFVYTMVDHIEAEAKSDAREARADARAAQAEEDNATDAMIYGMEAERRAGIITGGSYEDDLKRLHNGEFGQGKKAAARMLRLQAATKTGQKMVESDPQFAYYSSQLQVNFKPRTIKDGMLLLQKTTSNVDMPTYREMVSYYEEKVHSGEKPGDAYREAVSKYQPKGKGPQDELSNIRQQIEALKAKRAGR